MLLGSVFFWDIRQRRVVILFRRFGKPIGPMITVQEVQEGYLTLEDGSDMLSRKVGTELQLNAT
jgi:hypothetical protein